MQYLQVRKINITFYTNLNSIILIQTLDPNGGDIIRNFLILPMGEFNIIFLGSLLLA